VTGGQDATVEALRYIAQGWQDDSVLKDLQVEASKAADVVTSLVAGKGVPSAMINGKVNNQFMDVPAAFLPVNNITASNIGDVVKAGVWTWPEICKGIESTDICKKNR
jgi:D-xylose transport system substrate-binding protein